MFWSSSGQVRHGLQLSSMTTFLNSNAHDICYRQSSISNVHLETWCHDQQRQMIPTTHVHSCQAWSSMMCNKWYEESFNTQCTHSHTWQASFCKHMHLNNHAKETYMFSKWTTSWTIGCQWMVTMPFEGLGWWMKTKWDNLPNKFIIWKMNYV
jgi:hypothetical protein